MSCDMPGLLVLFLSDLRSLQVQFGDRACIWQATGKTTLPVKLPTFKYLEQQLYNGVGIELWGFFFGLFFLEGVVEGKSLLKSSNTYDPF